MKKLVPILGLLSVLLPAVALPCLPPSSHNWKNSSEATRPDCYAIEPFSYGNDMDSWSLTVLNECNRAVQIQCEQGCTDLLTFDASTTSNDLDAKQLTDPNLSDMFFKITLGKEGEPETTAFEDSEQVVSFVVHSKLVKTMVTQAELDELKECEEGQQDMGNDLGGMGQDMGVDMKDVNMSEPTASDDNLDDGCSAVGGAPTKNTSWMLLIILAFVGLFRKRKQLQG